MFQTPAVQFMIRRIYLLAETSSEIKNILHAEMKFLTLSSSDLAQSAVDAIWFAYDVASDTSYSLTFYITRHAKFKICFYDNCRNSRALIG